MIQRSCISYSSQARIIVICLSLVHIPIPRLLRVVDVVDQVLHDRCGVGGLHVLAVMGDDGAGGGADDNGTFLALFQALVLVTWM